MHRVERDDMARDIKLFQQFLHRRYLVGFFVNLDMRQHQRRIGGKSAEYLSRLGIVEGVKTASERLAMPVGASLPFRSAACSRKIFSTSAGSSPCRI